METTTIHSIQMIVICLLIMWLIFTNMGFIKRFSKIEERVDTIISEVSYLRSQIFGDGPTIEHRFVELLRRTNRMNELYDFLDQRVVEFTEMDPRPDFEEFFACVLDIAGQPDDLREILLEQINQRDGKVIVGDFTKH